MTANPYRPSGKPFTRSKTLWASVLTFAAGAGIIVSEYQWPGMWGSEVVGAAKALILAALAFGMLRFRTSAPVSPK